MCMWCRGGITTEGVSMAAMLKTEEGFVETTRFPRMIVSGLPGTWVNIVSTPQGVLTAQPQAWVGW